MSDLDPKERMWREAENAQIEASGACCLNTGEWLAIMVLTFVFAALLWHHFQ
jgi:hypothetical protein